MKKHKEYESTVKTVSISKTKLNKLLTLMNFDTVFGQLLRKYNCNQNIVAINAFFSYNKIKDR